MRTDIQRNYWKQVKNRRTPDHPVIAAYAAGKIRVINQVAGTFSPEATLLELGAGNGFFSLSLSAECNVHATDISPERLAKHPFLPSRKTAADANMLPFADHSFDIVFCANLLHHVEDPVRVVAEMRRVAKRWVVLVEPNARNPLMALFGMLVPVERGTLKFTRRYIARLARETGLHTRLLVAHGILLPNKTPPAFASLLIPLERCMPLGMYLIGVFEVPKSSST